MGDKKQKDVLQLVRNMQFGRLAAKKLKLSMEETAREQAEELGSQSLDRLFSKKYEYPQSETWSLNSSKVYGPLIQAYDSVQNAEDHEEGIITHTQQEDWTGNRKHLIKKSMHDKKLRMFEQQTSQEVHQKTVTPQESHENTEAPGSPEKPCASTRLPRDSQHSVPQIKSPRFLEGRQYPPNKFRRKTAPTARTFRKTRVTLPTSWLCRALIAEKRKLNELKDKLSDKEMITWHRHTNFTNLAGKVVGEMKSRFGVELCTQAWCKFHEILASFDVVPPSVLSQPQAQLNSIHLCEAPGAFITSLNHYLVSRGVDTRNQWQWVGTTLNPYYEANDTGRMINDDRFIRTTYDNWFFGTDNSGDLMSLENMCALMDRAQTMGDIQLVTADGSIDCQGNPAEQEVIVSRLHQCEVLCSCLLLARGGTLVIKLFTMFEASSITLLYFLNCVFERVTVCKPATSKSGNSEVYAVCSGYTVPLSRDALLSVFSAVCTSNDSNIVLFPREDVPNDFINKHHDCCAYFCKLQSDTIKRNLRVFNNMTEEEKKKITDLQDQCVEYYVRQYRLQNIDNEARIRPFGYRSNFTRFSSSHQNQDLNRNTGHPMYSKAAGVGSSSVSVPNKRLGGTFHERQQQNQFPWQQQLEQMEDHVVNENASQRMRCRHKIPDRVAQQWELLYGKELQEVASTMFVDCRLVPDLKVMLQHAKVDLEQKKALASYSTSTFEQAVHQLRSATQKTHQPCVIYHVPMEDSVTGSWPKDSPELAKLGIVRRLRSVKELERRDRAVGVVVDVTRLRCVKKEEAECQRHLVEVALHICSYLPRDSSVALIMPLALTRLTAGLIYIMATLFQETSFASSSQNVFLHQTLVFHHFSPPVYHLLTLLESLRRFFSPSPQPVCTLFPENSDDRVSVSGGSDRKSECYASKEKRVRTSDMSSSAVERKGGHGVFADEGVTSISGRKWDDGRTRCREQYRDKGCDCVTTDVRGTCSHCTVLKEMSDCMLRRQSGDANANKPTDAGNVPECSQTMMNHPKRGRAMSDAGDTTALDTETVASDSERVVPQDVDMTPVVTQDDRPTSSRIAPSDPHSPHSHSTTPDEIDMTPTDEVKLPQTEYGDSCHKLLSDRNTSSLRSTHCDTTESQNPRCDNTPRLSASCQHTSVQVSSQSSSDGSCSSTPVHHQTELGVDSNSSSNNSAMTTDTFQPGSSSSHLGSNEKTSQNDTMQNPGSSSHPDREPTNSPADRGDRAKSDRIVGRGRGRGRLLNKSGQQQQKEKGVGAKALERDQGGESLEASTGAGAGAGGDAGADAGGNAGGAGADAGAEVKMVPLEIVPVLDLINDYTFTRFLQASHKHSITRFLAAMKSAEQARLAPSHQQTQ